jgi:asparagine synthase (glutamine-hydrolysing)
VDLSEAANQPFRINGYQASLIFNGEIYNFREIRNCLSLKGYTFTTSGDSEVLLTAYQEWGYSCLDHLKGMFAFAIYDEVKNIVFAARDRVGEKPFFYHQSTHGLMFASELKALYENKSLNRKLNLNSLDVYLERGFVPGGSCMVDGFNKLPPANALVFDLGQGTLKKWQYWQIPDTDQNSDPEDEDTLLLKLEKVLEASVARQLQADVPVGVLLSGGVDSSLITALASRQTEKLKTFSLGFPGHKKEDETPHAKLIANYFNTEHIELFAEPASADILPSLIEQFDEPMVDSSMIPTFLLTREVKKHCTVALGGDGGDELFGGYPHYSQWLTAQRYLSRFPSFVKKPLAQISQQFLPLGFKGRNFLNCMDKNFEKSIPRFPIHFDTFTRKSILKQQYRTKELYQDLYLEDFNSCGDIVGAATRADFKHYLAEDILVKVDRCSMLSSLELRSPFLDVDTIEFAFSKIQSNLKATPDNKKILLKKLAKKILPKDFNLMRKQGFSIPMNSWLEKGPFKELFWDVLTAPDCIFEPSAVNKLLKGQSAGRNNGERIFALAQFEMWRSRYGISM